MSCLSGSLFCSSPSPGGCCFHWRNCNEKGVVAMVLLGTVISVGLLIYLVVALLKPEWF